ncbi:MAG TPA: PQQ-dependent sugar dehydrogenase [Nitrososphaeraceae archaeon]
MGIEVEIFRLNKMINTNSYFILSVSLFLSMSFLVYFSYSAIYAQEQQQNEPQSTDGIILSDPNLKLELVTSGLDFPTTMAFLDDEDFLILEKSGTVKRVVDGQVLDKPLLQVDVSVKDERGLLGIAVNEINENRSNSSIVSSPNKDISHNVFLYYTVCKGKNEDCENQIFAYNLDNKNNVLVNPKLLLSIPSFPDPAHIGGIIDIGPDNNLYFTVGNFENTIPDEPYKTKTQNFEDGEVVDGRAGILRITQDGKPVNDAAEKEEGIIGNEYPLNLYYAYGVKNSFGIDFDPVTGKLWLTENGPRFGDEINLAEPGFNSGSDKIFGIWRVNEEGKKLKADDDVGDEYITVTEDSPSDLVYFNGKGHYSPPKFTWDKSVAPTALLFLDSDKLSSQYQNDMFVGSVDGGRIFHFDLNENRTELLLKGVLEDKIASDSTEYNDILFAEGFSIITDIKQGPDGYLYIVSGLKQSKTEKPGAVYRILPS